MKKCVPFLQAQTHETCPNLVIYREASLWSLLHKLTSSFSVTLKHSHVPDFYRGFEKTTEWVAAQCTSCFVKR